MERWRGGMRYGEWGGGKGLRERAREGAAGLE